MEANRSSQWKGMQLSAFGTWENRWGQRRCLVMCDVFVPVRGTTTTQYVHVYLHVEDGKRTPSVDVTGGAHNLVNNSLQSCLMYIYISVVLACLIY